MYRLHLRLPRSGHLHALEEIEMVWSGDITRRAGLQGLQTLS